MQIYLAAAVGYLGTLFKRLPEAGPSDIDRFFLTAGDQPWYLMRARRLALAQRCLDLCAMDYKLN